MTTPHLPRPRVSPALLVALVLAVPVPVSPAPDPALDPADPVAPAAEAAAAETVVPLPGGRVMTRVELLEEVERAWDRPQVVDRVERPVAASDGLGLREKLRALVVPRANFAGMPLSRVVESLSALSEECDPAGGGINFVFLHPDGADPTVHLTLRQLSLGRMLDFIVESVGYEYEVQPDAVVVQPGQGGALRLETDFFPITRSTIIRLTGLGQTPTRAAAAPAFGYAPPSAPGTPTPAEEETALRLFLQRAGIPFDAVPGANLALADGQLIVTHTARYLEKVRNLLRRYNEVKQVEIEAKFMEVHEGNLEELGFTWTARAGGRPLFDASGNPVLSPTGDVRQQFDRVLTSPTRSLAQAFGVSQSNSGLLIQTPSQTLQEPVDPPAVKALTDLAVGAPDLVSLSGVVGSAEIDLLIRALSRQKGNDLMSAPKITVLSGKTAQIVVAQELRYPESYGDAESQVGRGEAGEAGSAGVAITTGTPRDFATRNVGVEMEVTPTVEDDRSISLLLEPKVTEFEGFVEYGGASVAISGGTTVKVPSGYFQPVFSVRRVRTEVTIWDGATVIMGGLTREQAVSVEDKVPLLGDIPLLGRLFRSEGQSSEKRNLLIFVTANLISPGGSAAQQEVGAVEPGALYQNPAVVTPAGPEHRRPPKRR